MSQSVKRNNKGRYCTAGKRYSSETYASIFKVAIDYQKVNRVLPLPAQLSEMTSVSFKVTKKALQYIFAQNKWTRNGYSGFGSMTLSMTEQFFDLDYITKTKVVLFTAMSSNFTNFPELK